MIPDPPTIEIRCSKLDDLFACVPSVLAQDNQLVRIKSTSDAAKLGKAIHEMAAQHVESGGYDIAAERGRIGAVTVHPAQARNRIVQIRECPLLIGPVRWVLPVAHRYEIVLDEQRIAARQVVEVAAPAGHHGWAALQQ